MRLSEYLNARDPEHVWISAGQWCGTMHPDPYTKTLNVAPVQQALQGCALLLVDIDDTLLRTRDGALTDPQWPAVLSSARAAGTYVCVVSSRMPDDHASALGALDAAGLTYDRVVFTDGSLKTSTYTSVIKERSASNVVVVDDNSSVLVWGARVLMCLPVDVVMFRWVYWI